jgi:hypothetical protein
MLYDNNSNIKADRTTVIAPSYGGGININLGASARLNIQEAFHHTSADKIDINVPDEKATFLFHTIAVTFDLSKSTANNYLYIIDSNKIKAADWLPLFYLKTIN